LSSRGAIQPMSLLAAAEHEGALILPVLVGPCRFNRTPGLADYQAVNSPERTLMEMSEAEQDPVWLQLADRIEDALAATVEPQRSEPRSGKLVARRGSASAPAQRGDGTEPSGDRLPDLYLLVRQEVADNRLLLSFQLKTRDGALGPRVTVFTAFPRSQSTRALAPGRAVPGVGSRPPLQCTVNFTGQCLATTRRKAHFAADGV
jgi:hypothetical protein